MYCPDLLLPLQVSKKPSLLKYPLLSGTLNFYNLLNRDHTADQNVALPRVFHNMVCSFQKLDCTRTKLNFNRYGAHHRHLEDSRENSIGGPELPRSNCTRPMQNWHHARIHSQARTHRYRISIRNPDLRSCQPNHTSRSRPVTRRWYWRRSILRHKLH